MRKSWIVVVIGVLRLRFAQKRREPPLRMTHLILCRLPAQDDTSQQRDSSVRSPTGRAGGCRRNLPSEIAGMRPGYPHHFGRWTCSEIAAERFSDSPGVPVVN